MNSQNIGLLSGNAAVRISRPKEGIGMLRGYNVYLDGRQVCILRNGEHRDFEVEPGSHLLSASIDWCQTDVLRIVCKADSREVVRVFSPIKGWKFLFIPFLILSPKSWIDIEWVKE